MTNINKTKINFVNSFINHCKKNYKDKISKIVVFGECLDPTINNPETVDFAVEFINKEEDSFNFNLLGELLSYLGDIVDEGDCSLVPIHEKCIKASCLKEISKGVVVYETC